MREAKTRCPRCGRKTVRMETRPEAGDVYVCTWHRYKADACEWYRWAEDDDAVQ
jgi:hypothetical protein